MKKIAVLLAGIIGISSIGSTLATTMPTNDELATWGYNNGLTKYENTSDFMWDRPITREQAAKMITAIVSQKALEIPMREKECIFNDETQIDKDLLSWVKISCGYGLFNGYEGNFMPKAYITAEDAITVAHRLAKQIAILQDFEQTIQLPTENKILTRGELLTALSIANTYIESKQNEEATTRLAKDQEALIKNGEKWKQQDIRSYTLTQTISCFCAPDYTRPIKYSVLQGEIITGSIIYADGNSAINEDMIPESNTIDQAFKIIQDAIERKADRLSVEYDATLGYPKSIGIDYDFRIADEEKYYGFELTR